EGHDKGQKEGHAAGYADGVKAGTDNGDKAGFARGLAEGKKAERDRIADLEAKALKGCEDLLKACIDDGESTAADLALRQVEYLQKQGSTAMAKQTEDEANMQAAKLPAPAQSDDGDFETTGAADDHAGGGEDEAVAADKAAWAKDEKLRAEFAGNRDQYLAFRDAERKGRLKHWKDKRAA
ncbi:MAG: hypothetical protein MJA83_10540, partial [Gammaproteobacteria bacterium]|nr:hypothetical protein [Gammaproteobacteria bacterium]